MLIFNDYLNAGGVEVLVRDFIDAFKDKYDITVITCRKGNDEDMVDGVRYYVVSPWSDIEFIGGITQNKNTPSFLRHFHNSKINKMHFDILLCMKSSLMPYALKINANRKIAFAHVDYDVCIYQIEELNSYRYYDYVVCVSQKVRDSIIRKIGDPGNLVVKYNPIPVEKILRLANEKSDAVLLPEKDPLTTRFIMIGNVRQQKGYHLLLEALDKLNADSQNYNYEVVVIGKKEDFDWEKEYVENISQKLNSHPNIRYLGYQRNPYRFLKEADWFLSTSVHEGYSLSLQEAMLFDLPILATKVSGVDELIGNDEYGITMDINAEDIYASMKMVLDNPSLKQKYAEKSKERKAIISYHDRLDKIEDLFG